MFLNHISHLSFFAVGVLKFIVAVSSFKLFVIVLKLICALSSILFVFIFFELVLAYMTYMLKKTPDRIHFNFSF